MTTPTPRRGETHPRLDDEAESCLVNPGRAVEEEARVFLLGLKHYSPYTTPYQTADQVRAQATAELAALLAKVAREERDACAVACRDPDGPRPREEMTEWERGYAQACQENEEVIRLRSPEGGSR